MKCIKTKLYVQMFSMGVLDLLIVTMQKNKLIIFVKRLKID